MLENHIANVNHWPVDKPVKRLSGVGSFGGVFKGIQHDGTEVAIKAWIFLTALGSAQLDGWIHLRLDVVICFGDSNHPDHPRSFDWLNRGPHIELLSSASFLQRIITILSSVQRPVGGWLLRDDTTVDGCELLHHQKDGWNPINNGINLLSTGAGFLLSTVPYIYIHTVYIMIYDICVIMCVNWGWSQSIRGI